MNVFILCTGRCGSTTFARACSHITNYTSGNESRHWEHGPTRLDYPENHIEADNRLSWLLGRLDQRYGQSAFYVHLMRNPDEVADGFLARWNNGIMHAYRTIISPTKSESNIAVAADFIHTVTANIELFLRNKTRRMSIQLDQAHNKFPEFWRAIEAQGDLDLAMREFSFKHNALENKLADC